MKKMLVFMIMLLCCMVSYGAKKYYSDVNEGAVCADFENSKKLMSTRDINESFTQKNRIGIGAVYEDKDTCTYWDINDQTKPVTGNIFIQRYVKDEKYDGKNMLHIDYLSVKKGVLNGYIEFYRAGKLEYRLITENGALVEGIHYRDDGCFTRLTADELIEFANKYTCGEIKQ